MKVDLTEEEIEFIVKLTANMSLTVTGEFVQVLYDKLADLLPVRGKGFDVTEIMRMYRFNNDHKRGWDEGYAAAANEYYSKGYLEGYEDGVNDKT